MKQQEKNKVLKMENMGSFFVILVNIIGIAIMSVFAMMFFGALIWLTINYWYLLVVLLLFLLWSNNN